MHQNGKELVDRAFALASVAQMEAAADFLN